MAKRSYTKKYSELDNTEDVEVLESEELLQSEEREPQKGGYLDKDHSSKQILVTEESQGTTTLVLTKDIGTLKVTGPVSGTLYTFHGAGSELPIKNEDVEGLLNKINPTGCCPHGSPKQPYFQLIE